MSTIQPAILDIIRKAEDRYVFQLSRPSSQPFRGPGNKVWEVQADPTMVKALCKKLGAAVDAANDDPEQPGVSVRPFITLGRGLYNCLLPLRQVEGLRRELQELEGPLLISTDDPDIPWELMTDGDEEGFFCFKYDVGRSLRAVDVPSWAPPRDQKDWRCLIIVANPMGDLTAAASEAVRLGEWLKDRGVQCDYVSEGEATFDAVLEKLLEPYDIIHYAGHVGVDVDGSTYCMRLQDKNFYPDNIRTIVCGNPIVFLNGCTSARAVRGLADAFISAGARLVIGSMFNSPDDGARAFAEKFYEMTLNGKQVGEAMRLARKHVKGTTEWGAAWACFIVYGDPCLQLELKVDDFQVSLRQLGLDRDSFDSAAGRVLQQAVAYGLPSGSVDTAHLFAAMVGGEDAFLRDRLRTKRLPPEALEAAFQEAFKAIGNALSSSASSQSIRYSANVQSILRLAKESGRSTKISERDLVRAFVQKKGGGTGEILKSLGVAVTELDPDASTREASSGDVLKGLDLTTDIEPAITPEDFATVKRVGPLTQDDCSADAWVCIVAGAVITATSGRSHIGTPELFQGMALRPGGGLREALRRFGVQPSDYPANFHRYARKYPPNGECPCTTNAGAILLEAQADAAIAGGVVTERHLVEAFVRIGGGSVGQALAQRGIVLAALTSRVFREGTEIDMSLFDRGAHLILEGAMECASRKRHPAFGRRHVLHSALSLHDGVVARAVRQQGRDPELLADQIYAEMESGTSRTVLTLAMASMSTDLVSVLCQAEKEARLEAAEQISEESLFRAWLADGGGDAGAFLARNGVKLRSAL